MFWIIEAIAYYTGVVLLVFGSLLSIISVIGYTRSRDKLLRLYSLKLGAVGGYFYPLIGLALLSISMEVLGELKYLVSGVCFLVAIIISLITPLCIDLVYREVPVTKEEFGEEEQ